MDVQRQEYEALDQSHEANEKDQRHTLNRQHEREMPDCMRALLTPKPQLHLKPRGSDKAPDEKQLKRMRHAVDNYLADKKTRDMNAYELQLQNAEKKVKDQFKRETKSKLDSLRQEHQKERDQFLQFCEKDHTAKKS